MRRPWKKNSDPVVIIRLLLRITVRRIRRSWNRRVIFLPLDAGKRFSGRNVKRAAEPVRQDREKAQVQEE